LDRAIPRLVSQIDQLESDLAGAAGLAARPEHAKLVRCVIAAIEALDTANKAEFDLHLELERTSGRSTLPGLRFEPYGLAGDAFSALSLWLRDARIYCEDVEADAHPDGGGTLRVEALLDVPRLGLTCGEVTDLPGKAARHANRHGELVLTQKPVGRRPVRTVEPEIAWS
jgi:hypothetical protein